VEKISVERLQEILLNHKLWIDSGYTKGERADLRDAYLRDADLRGAYLRGAYLRDADLGGADLRDADLGGADGEKIEIKKAPIQISNLYWPVTIWDNHMQIGCEFHSHEEWEKFDDERIKDMDDHATEFWIEWKTTLLGICEKHRK